MARERRKRFVGRVTSDKMDQTVVVTVETLQRHPRYRRVIKRRTRFMAHDEGNTCSVGDLVRIVESRPYSKEKAWRVEQIVTKGEVIEIKPSEVQ